MGKIDWDRYRKRNTAQEKEQVNKSQSGIDWNKYRKNIYETVEPEKAPKIEKPKIEKKDEYQAPIKNSRTLSERLINATDKKWQAPTIGNWLKRNVTKAMLHSSNLTEKAILKFSPAVEATEKIAKEVGGAYKEVFTKKIPEGYGEVAAEAFIDDVIRTRKAGFKGLSNFFFKGIPIAVFNTLNAINENRRKMPAFSNLLPESDTTKEKHEKLNGQKNISKSRKG